VQDENVTIALQTNAPLEHPLAKLYAKSFVMAYKAVGVNLCIAVFDHGIIICFKGKNDFDKYCLLKVKLLSRALDLIFNFSQGGRGLTWSVDILEIPQNMAPEEVLSVIGQAPSIFRDNVTVTDDGVFRRIFQIEEPLAIA